jgi:hypothetical protein
MKRVFEFAAGHAFGRPTHDRRKRLCAFEPQPDSVTDPELMGPFGAESADGKIINENFERFPCRQANTAPEPSKHTLFGTAFDRPVEFCVDGTGNRLLI